MVDVGGGAVVVDGTTDEGTADRLVVVVVVGMGRGRGPVLATDALGAEAHDGLNATTATQSAATRRRDVGGRRFMAA